MPGFEKFENDKKLRVIMTARDEKRIYEGVRKGFFPLIKKIEPSDKIRSKYMVIQHKKTGEIETFGDARVLSYFFEDKIEDDYEVVIEWTYYYPHSFKSPFAAYLIPKDIEIGERVFVQDLIEDYVGARWNQGNIYRLKSCEAIWNGKSLEIQYNPNSGGSIFFG